MMIGSHHNESTYCQQHMLMIIVIAAIISVTLSPLICILCLPLPSAAVCLSCSFTFPLPFSLCVPLYFGKNFIYSPVSLSLSLSVLLSLSLSPNLLIPIVFIHYYFPRHKLPARQQINISLTLAPLNSLCAYSAACFVVGDGCRVW